MDVSYNKFFEILIDRKMKKKDICEQAGIATSGFLIKNNQSLASGSVENPLAD